VAMTVEGRPGSIGAGGVASLAYVGPVATAFAYWAVVETGRHLRASTMSIALLATPSLGILISTLTLGETVGASLVAGVVLIGTGIRLAAIAPKGADAASVPRAASAPIELSRLDSARVSRCKREL
jgi:drug/metabolite transporter (DMT)-like permease